MYTADTNESFGLVFPIAKFKLYITIGYYKLYLSPFFNFSFLSNDNVRFSYLIDLDVVSFTNNYCNINCKKGKQNIVMDVNDNNFDKESQKKVHALSKEELFFLFEYTAVSAMINLDPDLYLEQQCHYIVIADRLSTINTRYTKKIKQYLDMLKENEMSSELIENIIDTFVAIDDY